MGKPVLRSPTLIAMPAVTLSPAFLDAVGYATRHFEGRVRSNTGVPAIAHALAVTALVLDQGGDETEAIAAMLHDVVEDHGGPAALAVIRERWGSVVAGLVEECTDELEPSGRPWRAVKADYLDRMPTASAAALRISLADKTDNTRTLLRGLGELGDELFTRHTAGDRQTFLWYYEALVEQFHERREDLGPGSGSMLAELQRVVGLLRAHGAASG